MQEQQAIITSDKVTLTFGEDIGVRELSLSIPNGTIFGMIGPSGSGKTTAVRLLTGLYRADSGKMVVLGQSPDHFSTKTREAIGYMPQHFTLYPGLTVWENLSFVASLYGMNPFRRRKRLDYLVDFVELRDARNRLGGKLSGGMQRRLSLACSLVHDPTLLFADEPTAGIDPILRSKFWEFFRNLRDEGHTLFVTTQYVGEAAYCDLVGVMREGRLVHLDTPEGLRKTALGGEVIKLTVQPERVPEAAQILDRSSSVLDIRRSRSQPGLLYVYVVNASEILPQLVNALSSNQDINIQSVEEYQPPFDEIFVTLMEKAESNGV